MSKLIRYILDVGNFIVINFQVGNVPGVIFSCQLSYHDPYFFDGRATVDLRDKALPRSSFCALYGASSFGPDNLYIRWYKAEI